MFIKSLLVIGFILFSTNQQQAGAPLVINELMASNSSTIQDPQGQYDDWIEIYNSGNTAINVGGMYLTDDLSIPIKWRIPQNNPSATTIPAHGYLLIWADEDTADSGLHAGFKLSADGEEVCLFSIDGSSLIDSIAFDRQTADISYGCYPDGGNIWQYMATPTPGTRNIGGYIDVVAEPEFSHNRGFYDMPFSVSITTETEGADIYYTLDGSEPYSFDRGVPTGIVYRNPIFINTTTCLRAVAVKNSWAPSSIVTQTYIFLDDVIRQATDPVTGSQTTPPGYPVSWGSVAGDYQVDPDVVGQNGKDRFDGLYARTIKDDLKSVPTISLVMNKDDWFGPTGIYINQSQDGTERVCSLEWIDPNDEGGFQVNCAIAMQGGADTTNPAAGTSLDRWKVFKLSMRPRFKTMADLNREGTIERPTGGPSQLKYRVFPDSPIEIFDTFVLDGVLTNAWNHAGQHQYGTYIQDQYVSDLANAMGGHSPHGLYAHLYINGLYWGMYYVHERPDDAWAAQMFGGEKEEYDVIKHNLDTVINNGLNGSAKDNFNAMLNAANQVAADPTNAAKYDALCRMLDIDNFIADTLAHWYAINWDWADNNKNWYATHRSPDGLWRFHSWDSEHSMEWWNSRNALGWSIAGIHDKLKANPEYRMRFADQAHRHCFNGGALTVDTATSMYRARMVQIDRAIVGESARWGDTRQAAPHTREDWLNNQNEVLSHFIPSRSNMILDYLKQQGLYPNVEAPAFRIDGTPQHGGPVAAGSQLSIIKSSGTIWYTVDGSEPRLPGSGGGNLNTSTLVPENAVKKVLVPNGPISENWRSSQTFNDSSWTSGTGGVGYERGSGYEALIDINVETQMYNRSNSCYIRIPFATSSDPREFNFLMLNMRYDDGFIAYINGTEVQRALFTGTPAWNSQADGNHEASDVESFEISGHLNLLQQGQNILAIHGLNASATSSDFIISAELIAGQSSSPQSSSISPTAVRYTEPITLTKSTHVKSRVLDGSTWSALNEATFVVGPVAENLRITEIMYHPSTEPNEEFIELTNIGTESINLNLVRFTEGIDFTFGDINLLPGAYIVVVKDINTFTAQYGTTLNIAGRYSGSLSDGGERIRLEDAVGQTILDFEYKDGWLDITDGGGYSLTIIDACEPDLSSWSVKSSWRASIFMGGSPGWDDMYIPDGSVVINEVLAHSHAVAADWIELHNTTGIPINIGGWFLSDNGSNPTNGLGTGLTKYRIADGTIIAPYGYIVFYEDLNFNNVNDPGCFTPFALSENGETVYLTSAQDNELTGYRHSESFGASQTGISFGRYYKSSIDNFNFVAMSENTPGQANSYPKVGPVVINEIMYNPASGNQDEEYIELCNISSAAITLYDYEKLAPWKFTDGVEYEFAVETPIIIPAGGYLLVVKNPTAFALKYNDMPIGVQVLGPYEGQLSNSGEKVELSAPGEADEYGNRYYIQIELVNYSDGTHPQDCPGGVDLWPVDSDGGGLSLSRRVAAEYGNDVANWGAALSSPGR